MNNKDIDRALRNIQPADYVEVIGDLAASILQISEEEFRNQYEIYKLKKKNYPLTISFVIEQFFSASYAARRNKEAVEKIEHEEREQ
jgi:hypothetical protein